MQKLTILKIGGNLLDDPQKRQAALSGFSKINSPKILVHGGGKKASELCRQLGIEPKMWNGRRITDAATLEVVTMVYAGLLNKQLVADLQAVGCNAMGLSGADGNIILAKKRAAKEVDFGFAGDIEKIDKSMIISFLQYNITPVFCAITHDGKGQLLNTNADTIATQLAAALAKDFRVALKYCFEKNGVLADPNDDGTVIEKLDWTMYQSHLKSGVINDGMIPKLDNAFDAKRAGATAVRICGINGIHQQNGTEICL